MLTVLDEFTRQALAVKIRSKMGAEDVLEVLYPLLLRHGTPEYIRSDNGPEFAAEATQDWLRRVGLKAIHLSPIALGVRILWAQQWASLTGPPLRSDLVKAL